MLYVGSCGVGLVGTVVKNGALVNLKDAQSDPLFDRTYDVKARLVYFQWIQHHIGCCESGRIPAFI